MMLREAVRHEIVASALIGSECIWLFFTDYVHIQDFEVASEAFDILKDLPASAASPTRLLSLSAATPARFSG